MGSYIYLSILLGAVPVTFSQTFPMLRYNIGSCGRLSDNAEICGSYTNFSTQGLLPSLFISHDDETAPSLRIVRARLLCEAIGAEKDTASSVSFLVEYRRKDDQLTSRLAQVMVDCYIDPHGPGSHSFYPTPAPNATGTALNTAYVATGTTLISKGTNIMATFSTEPRIQCGQCEHVYGVFSDLTTKCTSKLYITHK